MSHPRFRKPPCDPGQSHHTSPVLTSALVVTFFKCMPSRVPSGLSTGLHTPHSDTVCTYPCRVSCAARNPALCLGASCSHTTAECQEPLCQVRTLPSPVCPHKTPQKALPLFHRSYGLMRQSIHLLRFSAQPYTPGLCRLLPAPAGEWTFPTLSPQSLYRCLDPYPVVSLWCSFPFLPKGHRPHVRSETFGTPIVSCIAASAGHVFRGCSHSFMFRRPYSLGPQTAPTASLSRWAAGPFTPRIDHAVTQHELWYRYMPESGN